MSGIPGRLRAACAQAVPAALDDLKALLRLPSVSALGTEMTATAFAVAALMRAEGAAVSLLDRGGGFPAVLARFAGRSPRRILLYNHYDVQPADPESEWQSPPFQPQVRAGRLYARGAADNKGDLLCRLAAIRAWRALGGLPCGVTFLVDGEEEIGSPHLAAHLGGGQLIADVDACLWEFGGRDARGRASLHLGVKGLCYLELRASGPRTDLHSSLASLVANPLWRLTWALGTLKGRDGRIAVPGFSDDVRAPTPADRAAAARLPLDPGQLRRQWGVGELLHAGAAEAREALLFSPTCNICGVAGGYAGPGSKTVLPRQAVAKVEFRLVLDQDPARVAALVRAHLRAGGFEDLEVVELGHGRPYRTPPDDPFVGLVAASARDAYAAEPLIHPTSAGSGPMAEVAGGRALPIVSAGCGYWGAQAHAPDENIRVEDFAAGVLHVAWLLERLAVAGADGGAGGGASAR